MDYEKFFSREAIIVAEDLMGRILKTKKGNIVGQINQTGAYEGDNDAPSRRGMSYSPGTIFLMSYRGIQMFNIATDKEEFPSCVEIKEIDSPGKGRITGAGKITNYLGLKGLDGTPLEKAVEIFGEPFPKSKIQLTEEKANNCLAYFEIKRV